MSKYIILFFLLPALAAPIARAQEIAAGIDTVFLFKPGTGQNTGQRAPYFPGNIFGLPDTAARELTPVTAPQSVCSLGLGGEIIVGFKQGVLVNRPGPDFTVFENAFRIALNTKIFAEPGKIAVSRDGITFVEFPFDSLTLKGCAGVTPVHGDADPFNPAVSGGDSFDLEQIGMDSIRYIKITDISAMVKNNPNHPSWDPTISGFDLDAVVGLHLAETKSETTSGQAQLIVQMSTAAVTVKLKQEGETDASGEFYSLEGRKIYAFFMREGMAILDVRTLPEGPYILVVRQGDGILTKKILWAK